VNTITVNVTKKSWYKLHTHFSHTSNLTAEIRVLAYFKDLQGSYVGYIRTKLNQTGTFISIYKQVQFTFNNLTPSTINQKLELERNNVIGRLH